MKKDVYVVAHSHWDAEWYFTCEDSNILLIENVDYLMDLLERDKDFQSYSFDGLSIILDEYLEVRPEQRARLQKLISDRRLFVGPWYTQTDSLLVRSESLARNLIYGVKTAQSFGHSMNIGYLPDIFGQHAYLPSFFTDLGIEYSVLQRGLYTDQIRKDLNFYWRSPNMKKIATNCMYFGYGPGKFLSDETSYVEHRLLPILNQLGEMNTNTDRLLLPSGGDQVLANKTFPSTVKKLNALDLGYNFKMSNFEDYMDDVFSESTFDNIIDGELYACQKSRIHRTCHSTRVDMKQQTHTTEHLLLDQLEPLLVIAQNLGMEYPKAHMKSLWKKVFASHAHNGVEATNADQVNANVKNRLASVERSARSLINLYKKKITKEISNKLGQSNLLVVFNCDIHKLEQLVSVVVFTKEPQFSIVHSESNEQVNFSIKEQEALDGGQIVIVTAQGEKLEKVPDYYRSEILVDIKSVGALGYDTYRIEEKQASKEVAQTSINNTIENEYFAVSMNDNHLSLTQKSSNEEIHDFIEFVDCCDDGDEFDFAPLANDYEIRNKEFTLLETKQADLFQKMVVKSELLLPKDKAARIAREFEVCPVETTIEVRKGETFVRVTHAFENKAVEHRLRVHLKTNIKDNTYSYADQGYSIIRRESENQYEKDWKELKFVEKPVPIYTMENTVFMKSDNERMGLITKGIKEYEVIQSENAIALTLFRSVGLLGKDDTLWRPGRASGINNKVVHTPDALMLQPLTFEYAITMSENLSDTAIYDEICAYQEHWLTYQMQNLNTFEERLERFMIPLSDNEIAAKNSMIEIDNKSIFMSMCKDGESNNEMHIRLFNPTQTAQSFTLNIQNVKEIARISLLEEKQEALENNFVLEPKDYMNLCISFKKEVKE